MLRKTFFSCVALDSMPFFHCFCLLGGRLSSKPFHIAKIIGLTWKLLLNPDILLDDIILCPLKSLAEISARRFLASFYLPFDHCHIHWVQRYFSCTSFSRVYFFQKSYISFTWINTRVAYTIHCVGCDFAMSNLRSQLEIIAFKRNCNFMVN